MRNNATLQQLGIPGICNTLVNAHSIRRRNKSKFRNSEDSESEYDPLANGTAEEDLLDDDNVQASKDCNMRTTNMSTTGINLQSKRVVAKQESFRITRSKKTTAQPDATLSPSDIHVASPTLSCVNQATDLFGNIDGHTQATVEANGPTLFDEYNHVANGGHAIAWPDGHNLRGNEGDDYYLRSVVNTQCEQLVSLLKKMQETEESRIREQEEVKKRQAELEAKLQLVLS